MTAAKKEQIRRAVFAGIVVIVGFIFGVTSAGLLSSVQANNLALLNSAVSSASVSPIPIYRMYDKNTAHHFYTTNYSEAISLTYKGVVIEGSGTYVYPVQVTGTVPFYRMYNPTIGDHFYTASTTEYTDAGKKGYYGEGILGFVYTTPTQGAVPFYALTVTLRPNVYDSFYTRSIEERNAVINAGARDRGIAAYVLQAPIAYKPLLCKAVKGLSYSGKVSLDGIDPGTLTALKTHISVFSPKNSTVVSPEKQAILANLVDLIRSRQGSVAGDSRYDANFDLNNDGGINIADVILMRNFPLFLTQSQILTIQSKIFNATNARISALWNTPNYIFQLDANADQGINIQDSILIREAMGTSTMPVYAGWPADWNSMNTNSLYATSFAYNLNMWIYATSTPSSSVIQPAQLTFYDDATQNTARPVWTAGELKVICTGTDSVDRIISIQVPAITDMKGVGFIYKDVPFRTLYVADNGRLFFDQALTQYAN